MSVEWLLDTIIVIGLLKGSTPVVERMVHLQITLDRVAVSQITKLELLSFPDIGPEEEAQIVSFLSDCVVLPLDDTTSSETIRIRRATRLKLPDAIIAATARVNALKLVTLDQRLQTSFAMLS